jgi:S-adenosylmethionine decarboxylase
MNNLPTNAMLPNGLGQHLIADFYGATQLFDGKKAEEVLRQAAAAAGATVLDINLHDFGDRYGFTGVALLAESHISIHTWPENEYAAIDIFMCGDADPNLSLGVLREYFSPQQEQVQLFHRGSVVTLAESR